MSGHSGCAVVSTSQRQTSEERLIQFRTGSSDIKTSVNLYRYEQYDFNNDNTELACSKNCNAENDSRSL